jgi:hypothetical protein
MARYSAGDTANGAGTTLRPVFALLSTATVTPILREVAMFNTTAVACTYELVAFTGGTAGAGSIAERRHRVNAPPALCLARDMWTADATITENTGYRLVLGAAIGSGAILTFGAEGVEAALGATAGLGLVPIGTGQICEVYFCWDE